MAEGLRDDLCRIRESYDRVAADYARLVRDGGPWERALLGVFAETVPAGLPVADVGCGPGRVAAILRSLGLDAFGIDLSPGMVDVARRDHPGIRFEVGTMTALDLPDASLGGVLAWWSLVHLPPELLPVVFAEFRRVLAPGGRLLVGFHVGDDRRHKTTGYGGHPMDVEVYRRPPERLAGWAADVGLVLVARLDCDLDTDGSPQACLLFRAPD